MFTKILAVRSRPLIWLHAASLVQHVASQATSVPISREVTYKPHKKQKYSLILYQFQSCPFCCKVRAYLDIKGLNYSVVEVNSLTKSQVKWNPKYKKVPQLVVDDEGSNQQFLFQDSSQIISILASIENNPEKPVSEVEKMYPVVENEEDGKAVYRFPNKYNVMMPFLPDRKTQDDFIKANEKHISRERVMRRWIDEKFVHVISPNIYRTPREAVESFRVFSVAGNWRNEFGIVMESLIVYVGAAVMSIVGKKLKKQHGYSDDVRQEFYKLVQMWLDEVEDNQSQFHGGDEPDLADISFFGILTSFEGTQAFREMTENTKISKWFEAMKKLKAEPIKA